MVNMTKSCIFLVLMDLCYTLDQESQCVEDVRGKGKTTDKSLLVKSLDR